MTDFAIKAGNTLPLISSVLARADGTVADLSTASSITFVMRSLTSTSPLVSAAASVVGLPTQGQVTYHWAPADTAVPGNYLATWDVIFADGTKESFPTVDFLEVEVGINLTATGVIPVLRPTDGIRPRVSEVGALIANRGRTTNNPLGAQFGPRVTPNYMQVQSIISSVASELDGDLDGVAVTPALATLARWCITLAAAAQVELTFFPEQASNSGSTSALLWGRYQSNLTRFRDLLLLEGGGSSEFGSVTGASWTRTAVAAVVTDPSYAALADPFGFGSPFGPL